MDKRIEAAATRLVDSLLADSFPGVMNPYNPAVGSSSRRQLSDQVKIVSDFDKQLATNQDFQDYVGEVFADYDVDNFTDLEKKEPTAIRDLIRRAQTLLRSPSDKFPQRTPGGKPGSNLRAPVAQ